MRRVCVFREALSRSLGEEASECQVRKEWARLKGRTQACVDLEAGLCAGSELRARLARGQLLLGAWPWAPGPPGLVGPWVWVGRPVWEVVSVQMSVAGCGRSRRPGSGVRASLLGFCG